MYADKAICKDRVSQILSAYIGKKIIWLCGSNGKADETIVEFLVSNNEQVQVVGYSAYDISPAMLGIIEENDVSFIDPNRKQLPSGFSAPSKRDLLFLAQADLFVAFWNGKSAGTKSLIDWYMGHKKDVVIGFL